MLQENIEMRIRELITSKNAIENIELRAKTGKKW